MEEHTLKIDRPSDWLNVLREELTSTDGHWITVIFGASILSGGLMFTGYAVFDELIVCGLMVLIFFYNPRHGIVVNARPENGLQILHRYAFAAFSAYLVWETFRGMVALGDVRVIRFTAMFAALGIIGWFAHAPATETKRMRIARVIVTCAIIYFWCYVLVGVIYETAFGGWRFNLQGHLWVGTSAAFVPGVLMIPALLLVAQMKSRPDRNLFWTAIGTLIIAAFYYQSRLMWIALIVLIISLALLGPIRRAATVAICYLVFVSIFPWPVPRPLTAGEFARFVKQTVSEIPENQPEGNLLQFAEATFGSLVKTKLEHKVVTKIVIAPSGEEETVTEISDTTTSATDLDRKLAMIAAFRAITTESPGQFLFGTGYYTHRFVLLPYIHKVAQAYHYEFPETYNTIVRTATFNGMLVDTGIVGIVLFFAQFGFTWLIGLRAARASGSPVAFGFAISGTMAMLGLSLFVGSNFDMVILYLAVAPSGAVLAVLAGPSRTTDCLLPKA